MNFVLKCSVLLAVAFSAYAQDDIQVEEGVLVLTKSNFQNAISSNEYILVEFYAPWCGHCKALEPEYSKAALQLSGEGSSIKLGKVDAIQETELAEEHGVKSYPTIKFFINGSPIPYEAKRTAEDIVNWVTKKTGPPALALESVEAAKEFVSASDVTVIGFFKDQTSDKAKAFLAVANQVDDYPFGITSEDAVFSEYGAECGSIILLKKFDEGKAVFAGEYNEVEIKKFVSVNSLPLIVEFNHETAHKIFSGEIKSHLLLFLPKGDEATNSVLDEARSVAGDFRNNVLFVSIDTNEEDHQRIVEFFGMKKEEIPAARLIRFDEDIAKYKPPSNELTAENMRTFVQDYLDGKLKQHLLSQDLPDDWNATPVKTLVASNFDSIVFDTSKNVLVEFYAPWCGHCKQLVPIYDKVGEHFEKDEDVVIAKVDATVNELEHTKVVSYPTIKLYRKDDNKPIEYTGPRTFEGLTKFIESGGTEGAGPEESVEEEVEDDDAPRKDEL